MMRGSVFKNIVVALIVFAFRSTLAEAACPTRPEQPSPNKQIQNPLCTIRKNLLDQKVAHGVTPFKLAQEIANKNPKLILLGETHTGGLLRKRESEFLRTLKKEMPDLNCLYVEFADRKEAREQIEFFSSGGKKGHNYRVVWELERIVAMAASLGIQVIPADSPWVWTNSLNPADIAAVQERATTAKGIQERNKYMAGEISVGFLDKHQCIRSVALFGRSHLNSHLDGVDRPVQNALWANLPRSKVVTVHLQQAGDWTKDEFANDTDWRWKTCSENPIIPAKDVGFSNHELPDFIPMDTDGGPLIDFDYTLVMPIIKQLAE